MRPLWTEQAARGEGGCDQIGARAWHVGNVEAVRCIRLVDEAAGQHAKINLPAGMIHCAAAPQRIGDELQGAASCLGQQRRLVENLVEVDLEGETCLRVHRHLPKKENGLQEAVMPAIGAVDAKHIRGSGIGRTQMLDDLAAA